ncbi:MAG TPA: hypothetical protein VFX02_12175 [Gammaproteobacteria bacterium]|nr:hypothetical protein [Gammaproteobacteria bacterium]
MWFMFGFTTLIASAAYALEVRINAPSKGGLKDAAGFPYWYKVSRGKYGITGFRLSIKGPSGYNFSFKKETGSDRFFKQIGVCAEYQVGRDAFDKAIYIVSDDTFLCAQLSGNGKLTAEILKLFQDGETFSREIKELRCVSGYLVATYKVRNDYTEHQIFTAAQDAVPILARIGNELQHVAAKPGGKWRDPFVIKAAVILAISSALAISGFMQLVRIGWTKLPLTLDTGLLWRDSILAGGLIVAALIVATIMSIGRSARTHLVLIELLLFGAFGAVATSFSELRDINMELDTVSHTEYRVQLYDKYVRKGRHGRSYYFSLENWTGVGTRNIQVSEGLYDQIRAGEKVIILQRPGYLGYRWVESIARGG